MSIGPWQVVIVLLIFAIPAWLAGRIAGKAGYSGWWGIPFALPVIGIVLIWVFAFADWPVLKADARQARPNAPQS